MVVSAIALGMTLVKLKKHPKMFEVVYVWDLEHQLNLIYRKNRKLLIAAEQGNKDAMLALQFSYQGSRQLWQLDDNTIVMSNLNVPQSQLDDWIAEYRIVLSNLAVETNHHLPKLPAVY